MKKSMILIILTTFLVTCLFSVPSTAQAKKGGIGHGGGYSDDGILYHSHSDRSYSGKNVFKGKAKGYEGSQEIKTRKGNKHKKTQLNDF
ncbi:MAG: hypothetical protein GX443_08945 [Deltaproteobacteria bacterium]|nr:hypothetical protein [Deltaproteobacteria bacterium]